MTDDLVSWLRACLDDDESHARKLHAETCGHDIVTADAACDCDWHVSRALAEVQAKRAILDLCDKVRTEARYHLSDYYLKTGATDAMDEVVFLLAAVFSDRPGYREEWRP